MSTSPLATPPPLPSLLRAWGLNAAVWLLICAMGAAGNYRDEIRAGTDSSFIAVWGDWIYIHFPLALLSGALYPACRRHPRWLDTPRAVARLCLLLSLGFFPLHMLFLSIPHWQKSAPPHTLASWLHSALMQHNFTWFLEFAWFSGTVAVVFALCNWHIGQQRDRTIQASQLANLQLQLDLEQLRLRGLRQQLEPHFIFNALNGISALVRSGAAPVALGGIYRLSELLRYALSASSRDWVSLAEELQFCRDYLALQALRYGARLQVRIAGESVLLDSADCPALLLQPLLENALRHDLDCHAGASQLTLHLSHDDSHWQLQIRNPLPRDAPANPGLGLGLEQTRLRIALLYAGQGSFSAAAGTSHFEVQLRLPLQRPQPLPSP